ncbi:AEC family transporter [Arthrobacter sp. A5]|uniref:AEC family transporter n=1 Tax=Arthrobacter sp. A5 TaxID=576926 RepID=UPI003DA94720
MLGVLQGFSVIWVVILVGYLLGRVDVLGPDGERILSRLVFFVATPALMLQTLSHTDLRAVFSTSLLVAALSAFAASLVYLLVAGVVLKRPTGTALVGAMSASLVNAAYLGIPIAVYVLGDASFAAPVLIFQLAFYTPLFVLLLDNAGRRRRASLWTFLGQIPRNPVLIASLLGLLIAAVGWQPPNLVMQPFVLLGGAAVPGALLAFGISLHGSRPLQNSAGRAEVLLASAVKLALQPAVAFFLARYLLDLRGHALFAAVVLAALPTAQNVFIVASRYKSGVAVAKDTVLLTTAVGVPILVLVSALLA